MSLSLSGVLALAAVTVVTDVNIVDIDRLLLVPNQHVVIRGSEIEFVGPDDHVPVFARKVDGRGKYLAPALIDSHVHVNNPYRDVRLMLAHGVTGARDMGGNTLERLAAREFCRHLGFDLRVSGVILDGDPPYHAWSRPCQDEPAGRAAVEDLSRVNVDHVKVYGSLKKSVYQAIADECRLRKLPFDGHVPDSVSVLEAGQAGQRVMEHLYRSQSLISDLVAGFKPDPSQFESGVFGRYFDIDSEKLKVRLSELAKTGMSLCPTLILLEGQGRLPVTAERRKEWDTYALPGDVLSWTAPIPEQYAAYGRSLQAQFPAYLAFVKALDDAGVPLLVGTDLANGYTLAGRAVWDEMELWSRAGINPGRILQAATVRPAQILGYRDRGRVATGQRADLVLLDENPLKSVTAVRALRGVWADGKFFDENALRRLKAESKADLLKDIPKAGPLSVLSSKVSHFYLDYDDLKETFDKIGGKVTAHLDARSFGRVPVVILAQAQGASTEVTLKTMGEVPTSRTWRAGLGQKVQLLVSPCHSVDGLQWESLLKSKLPDKLRVAVWRSRASVLSETMSLSVNQSGNDYVASLRGSSTSGLRFVYTFKDGVLLKRVSEEFALKRRSELLASR